MGMFAAADNTLTRFAKVYLPTSGWAAPASAAAHANHRKNSSSKLSCFPTARNLRSLSNSIKATTWWASTDRVPLNVFDENGQKTEGGNARYYDLFPAHPRTAAEPLNWGVEIEYWKASL